MATETGAGTVTRPRIAPGAGVALITLFDSGGGLLARDTGDFAATLVASGAASVLVAGTVGEFYTLSDEERAQLFAEVRAAVPAQVPVIGHVGGVPHDRAARLARVAADAGLSAIIALAPDRVRLREYYGAIVAAAAELPLLAYHFPLAGAVIPVDAIRGLPVAGIKDSSGDSARLAHQVFTLDIEVYTGATALLGLAHDIGAAGAFAGLANVDPEGCALAIGGDSTAQREIARLGVELSGDFPGAMKERAAERFGVPAFARTPRGRPAGQGAR